MPGRTGCRPEQDAVADLHAIAHEIARLVVAHPVPGFDLDLGQVIDGEGVRFGLHQPVALAGGHAFTGAAEGNRVPPSVQIASTGTSHDATGKDSTCCTANAAPTSQGGAGRSWRKAKLRSYQPPPMPSRRHCGSKPTSGATTSAICAGSSVSAGATSGSGMP
ncbi:hypothetical protein G6F31_016454 [Rhizopus arrhizus]|nr:hypothetical protein G6F31_016454 [Rhizopus arrhizus]